MSPAERVVGVDGYPRGWVAVALVGRRFETAGVFSAFPEVLQAFADAACVGVDIPIGTGPREADRLARAFVGPRRASVFPAPTAESLRARTFAETTGVSRQTFALFAKIREVAECLEPRVIEVHPEVSFRALKGDYLHSVKTTWNGFAERRALLGGAGIALPDELDPRVPLVDVLDAAVAAWSANRYVRGEAERLGDDRAEIWF